MVCLCICFVQGMLVCWETKTHFWFLIYFFYYYLFQKVVGGEKRIVKHRQL